MLPNISVSWLTSCWKTSYSKKIAESFWYQRVIASAVLLELSTQLWYQEFNVWDDKNHYRLREQATKLNQKREFDKSLDTMVDETIGNKLMHWKMIIAETLTAPLIYGEKLEHVLKIYFDTSLETRSKWSFLSSNLFTINELMEKVHQKDSTSQKLIKEIRNIDIFDKKLIYDKHDVVIDDSAFDEIENKAVNEKCKKIVQELLWSIVILHQVEQKVSVIDCDYKKALCLYEKHQNLIKKNSLLTP